MSQPPAINSPPVRSADEYRQIAANIKRRHAKQTSNQQPIFLPRLIAQIRQWHESLPDPVKQSPRTLDELRNLFTARMPGKRVASYELGSALRALGWSRQRQWSGYDRPFKRYWVPPTGNNPGE